MKRSARSWFWPGILPFDSALRVDCLGHLVRVRYGLASFRWFQSRSFLFGDPDEVSDSSKDDVGLGEVEVAQQMRVPTPAALSSSNFVSANQESDCKIAS